MKTAVVAGSRRATAHCAAYAPARAIGVILVYRMQRPSGYPALAMVRHDPQFASQAEGLMM